MINYIYNIWLCLNNLNLYLDDLMLCLILIEK